MADVARIEVSPILAKLEAIGAEMQAALHQESVIATRWMVGCVFSTVFLVFALFEFVH